MGSIFISCEDVASSTTKQLLQLLETARSIRFEQTDQKRTNTLPAQGLPQQILVLADILSQQQRQKEADALNEVYVHIQTPTDFGGLGFDVEKQLSPKDEAEILFLVSAYLQSLRSVERSKSPPQLLNARPDGRRGMTLSEKIFAAHDIDGRGWVKPGDVVLVDVDWIMASELSWSGMEKMHNQLGSPEIFRNDRFWLAGDHVVDPRVSENPKIKALVDSSERARQVFKMTEYQGMNYTIMHTDFCRERAQPGQLVIGSDSHTCSAGSMGALAIGLGTADVTMPLITGETWFRIPESVSIRFTGRPSPGIGGKDVILYILKELKRNTVAADRVVEFCGPGLKYLSCDARFAIANMTTEFGGVTGIFVPDEVTSDYIQHRKNPKYRNNSTYFRPDEDAQYAVSHTIDLAKVESFIARYPSPDDVVPVSELEGTPLDGCFIGACTTAEEDLILGALILEVGLKRGLKPVKHGKRKVVPGSMPILNKLRKLGLTEVYEQGGFEVGIPGCSYCVGLSADKANKGEVWLSSQNRNFENRMGPGSIGHVSSAVTVAASAFAMKITNPQPLLDAIDRDRMQELIGRWDENEIRLPTYMEPASGVGEESSKPGEPNQPMEPGEPKMAQDKIQISPAVEGSSTIPPVTARVAEDDPLASSSIRQGKIQRLGDFIDTDALAPGEALISASTPEGFAEFCLKHTHPDFRRRAKEGHTVVVAGNAFGCGSSREVAVTALLGCKIQCVIAKSFAFIYGRNQPNLGLLGIVMTEPEFYETATDGTDLRVDLDQSRIEVGTGADTKVFNFEISPMERQLIECGGMTEAFKRWGKGLWEEMTRTPGKARSPPTKALPLVGGGSKQSVQW